MGNPHFWPILTWTAVLAVVVAIGGVVMVIVRRRLFQGDGAAPGVQLSLHDLREMHKRGEIEVEEFEALRSALLGGAASTQKGAERAREGTLPRVRNDADLRAAPGLDLTGEALPKNEDDNLGRDPDRAESSGT